MSSGEPRVLIVIPALNEEGRIGRVVREAKSVLPGADVVVVDDQSSDGTTGEALAAGAKILRHLVNLGAGAGYETGYLYAVRHGYDCVLQMDGDGQHVAAELPAILAPVAAGDADLVVGSRYLGGDSGYKTPALRRLGQRVFTAVIRAVAGIRITDPTSGFRCLGQRALKLFSSGIFPSDFPDADVLLMGHYAGLKISEVRVRMAERLGGRSMYRGFRPVYYAAKMLLSIFIVVLSFRRWRKYVS